MASLAIKIEITTEAKKPHGYLAKLDDGTEIFIATDSVLATNTKVTGLVVYPIGEYSYATDDIGNMTTVRKVTDDIGSAADYVLVAGMMGVNSEREADNLPEWSPPQPVGKIDLPILPPIGSPAVAPTSEIEQSFTVSQSDVSGAVRQTGNNSPAAMATDLGRYKAKVYRAVGARWYQKVNDQISVLGVGTVHITYTIYSDGHMVIGADPAVGDQSLMLLHSISINSMTDAAPFDPFSDRMKKEVGDSYTDTFDFSVKGD